MSLSDQMDVKKREIFKRIPFFARNYMLKEIERINREQIASKVLPVGALFPSGELLDRRGNIVEIPYLGDKKPLIVSFYRGSWCPYCNLELREYARLINDADNEIRMVTISPESPDQEMNNGDIDNLPFTVLSDLNNMFANKLNIVFRPSRLLQFLYFLDGISLRKSQSNRKPQLPLPATFVVDGEGIITYVFAHSDYTKRSEPSDVIKEYLNVDNNSK